MAFDTWQNLNSDESIRWLKYSFGFGKANTLAVRMGTSWLVVSPSVGSPDSVFGALEGGVT